MNRFDRNATGEIILRVSWQSEGCRHDEFFRCHPVNLWRDILPPELEARLTGSQEGDEFSVRLETPPFAYQKSLIHSFPGECWQQQPHSAEVLPRLGRWYPQGFAAGLPNIFSNSILPMRVIGLDEKVITVDCNHPLAGRPLELGVRVGRIIQKSRERGGRCSSWLDEATDQGPGMQALFAGQRPDFQDNDGMSRVDEQLDSSFYRAPRLVGHIDRQASLLLQEFLQAILPEGGTLLDLMAAYQSHLPETFSGRVTGLGLNDQEMEANPGLHQRIVHDLNQNPKLPFDENSFEAVLCNLSFEYLIHPEEVCREIHRILQPGGLVVFSVSDRWFPPKVTRLWTRLHPFERLGYILENLRDVFGELTTTSFRGWPRPEDDPHPLPASDPLFVVTARKPGEEWA